MLPTEEVIDCPVGIIIGFDPIVSVDPKEIVAETPVNHTTSSMK